MGRLLDRYDAMQKRPFGTNTALTDGNQNGVGGTAGSQLRRQEKAYGRALRLLDRRARRGDVRSALDAIDVQKEAMGDGYSVGGIRDKEQADAGITGMIGDMSTRAAGVEQRNADIGVAGGITRRDAGGAAPGDGEAPPAAAGMSFDEIEREKRDRLTEGGAFGSGAQDRREAEGRASGILNRADRRARRVVERYDNQGATFLDSSYTEGTTDEDVRGLGGNKETFLRKVFSDSSPEQKSKYVDDTIRYAEGNDLYRVSRDKDVTVGDITKPEVLEQVKRMGGTPESFIGEVNRRRAANRTGANKGDQGASTGEKANNLLSRAERRRKNSA